MEEYYNNNNCKYQNNNMNNYNNYENNINNNNNNNNYINNNYINKNNNNNKIIIHNKDNYNDNISINMINKIDYEYEYDTLSPYSKPWIPIYSNISSSVTQLDCWNQEDSINYQNDQRYNENNHIEELKIIDPYFNPTINLYSINNCNMMIDEINDENYNIQQYPMVMTPTMIQCESADGFVYQVRFKYANKYYLLASSPIQFITNGDYVKVEADRGEDIGIVIGKTPLDGFKESRLTVGRLGIHHRDFKKVIGKATNTEISLLAIKLVEEKQAVEISRNKSFETNVPLRIVDAEFQFDRHKLTLYYEANRRIDFRGLVSEIFAIYKTRIWMQQIETTYQCDEHGTIITQLRFVKHQIRR